MSQKQANLLTTATIYSYCVAHDAGAAPNPFGGKCTLAICKPVIRRTAKINDWVVGLAGSESRLDNYKKKIIYLMRVSDIVPISEYYNSCSKDKNLTKYKIRDPGKNDYNGKVCDCIYIPTNGHLGRR